MKINSFKDIQPQKIVDHLCKAYQDIDKHLMHPKTGLPESLNNYWSNKDSKNIWLYTKYFRNIASLEKLESCINRLDEFWIAVEYFNGDIDLTSHRKTKLTKSYKDRFFSSILIDSWRSSLDIFAKYIAWYFDIPGKEELGFTYKNFIVPLKNLSNHISEKCNSIYKSESYRTFKNYRDSEKHAGFDKTKLNIKEIKNEINIRLGSDEILNISSMEKDACSNLINLIDLIDNSVSELKKWHLGYDSSKDRFGEEMSDGSIKICR